MAPATHPGTETSSAIQLASLLRGAGISPLDSIGWLRITGADRVRWLNGMATNAIQQLKPGEGNYNFFLNAQGRIQGDASIFAQQNTLLLETAAAQLPTLMPLLDRFIIMDDVELADITGSSSGIAVTGPEALSLLEKIGLPAAQRDEFEMRDVAWNSVEVAVIRAHGPLVPHFELWSGAETIAALTQAMFAAGATHCEAESREWLRILEGTPLYGIDIRDRDLPQETAQTRALHFNKGCYLGQEIVERIRSRGNVHRTFTAFRIEGGLPAAGAALETEGKSVGELTSVAAIPLPDEAQPVQLALGYIRREALERGAIISYSGGTAVPVDVPYKQPHRTRPSQHLIEESQNMSEQNKPFVVTDRRKFTLEGELRPDADPSPEKESKSVPVEAVPAPEPTAKAEPAPQPETAQNPDDEVPPGPTAEQTEQSRRAYEATTERLDTAVRATNPGMEHPPAVGFDSLVQSIYMTAIMQLGGATPEGQPPQVDILGARQSIDMLAVLAEKTKGNLTTEESQLLDSALFELRMAFLEITQAVARSAAAKAQQAAQGNPAAGPTGPRGPQIVR